MYWTNEFVGVAKQLEECDQSAFGKLGGEKVVRMWEF